MENIKHLERELKHLDNLIAQGEKFEEQGHDCGGLNYINYLLRNKVLTEINSLKEKSCI